MVTTDSRLERMERAAPRMFGLLRELVQTQPYHRLSKEAAQIIRDVEVKGETSDFSSQTKAR